MQILEKWVYKGVIRDPYEEVCIVWVFFMIVPIVFIAFL